MKQAVVLLALVVLGLELGKVGLGLDAVVGLTYGAIALMSLMISATFLWLWTERATPLALGMSFSWLGAGLVAGGAWGLERSGPRIAGVGEDAALVVLAVYIVGALLHFSVIYRSFGRHGSGFLWPVIASLALSGLAAVLFGG